MNVFYRIKCDSLGCGEPPPLYFEKWGDDFAWWTEEKCDAYEFDNREDAEEERRRIGRVSHVANVRVVRVRTNRKEK